MAECYGCGSEETATQILATKDGGGAHADLCRDCRLLVVGARDGCSCCGAEKTKYEVSEGEPVVIGTLCSDCLWDIIQGRSREAAERGEESQFWTDRNRATPASGRPTEPDVRGGGE